MKILSHPASVALGICTLCLLFLMKPFFQTANFLIYHSSSPVLPFFASAAIDWGLAWLLFTGLLALARKSARFGRPIWLGIILFMPWMLLKNCTLLGGWTSPHWLSLLVLVFPSAFFAGLFFFRRGALRAIFDRTQHFTATILSFAAPLGAVILLQFSWFAWQARHLNPPFRPNHSPVFPVQGPRRSRVIWILFDELSYQQLYERRFPGLDLPAFDRLKAQSTVFTHTVPAGIRTEIVIPSLFTGLPADGIRISPDGQLRSLLNPVSGAWQAFDPHQTVFQDAHDAGYTTGVAGWYNPYCRILPQVLDRCFWEGHVAWPAYLRPGATVLAHLSDPLVYLGSHFLEVIRPQRLTAVSTATMGDAVVEYKDICDAADLLLADQSSADFVFLHLPVPHPPGIYDRKRKTFTANGASYLDNLALADQYLAHARLVLEQQHQWDSSAVIVMGDHSWRTAQIWSSQPGWQPEEERASNGGHFDDRPAYIVKMPMQENALRIDARFQAVDTRSLMDAIISHQLHSGEEVQAWVQRHVKAAIPNFRGSTRAGCFIGLAGFMDAGERLPA